MINLRAAIYRINKFSVSFMAMSKVDKYSANSVGRPEFGKRLNICKVRQKLNFKTMFQKNNNNADKNIFASQEHSHQGKLFMCTAKKTRDV